MSLDSPVVPDLRSLTPQDVNFLDAVIQRAGPSSTTFLPIFNAYSAVLKEQEMDPQESIYYGKLLKLGTMKGRNWGDKWETVKSQLQSTSDTTRPPPSESSTRTALRQAPLRKVKTARPIIEPLELDKPTTPPPHFARRAKLQPTNPLPASKAIKIPFAASTVTSHDDEPSLPPSRRALFDPPPSRLPKDLSVQAAAKRRAPHLSAITKHALGQTQKPKRSADVDVDEVWKNVEMEMNERKADELYESKLVARCWTIWKRGHEWIVTTNEQVGDAYTRLLVEKSLHRWRHKYATRQAAIAQQLLEFNRKLQASSLEKWKAKYKLKMQDKWKDEMRQKMKSVREKADQRLVQNVWQKWREGVMARAADWHYIRAAQKRSLDLWKAKLAGIEQLEDKSDAVLQRSGKQLVGRTWNTWRAAFEDRCNMLVLAQRVDRRLLAELMQKWKNKLTQVRIADAYAQRRVQRAALVCWKGRMAHLENLENKASQHLASRDVALVRGAVQIWRSSMRGRRLVAYRDRRLLKSALKTWITTYRKKRDQLTKAAEFESRSASATVKQAFSRWRDVYHAHQRSLSFANSQYTVALEAKLVMAWRLRLRDHHQKMKIARWAHRFFTTRTAWRVWLERISEKGREKRLQLWEKEKMRKYLLIWHNRAREAHCVREVQEQMNRRIVRRALSRWLNRVVEIKSRELDVRQEYQTSLVGAAFQRWKSRHQQHVELQKLLESQMLVKREALQRQAFRRWLTVMRQRQHRRRTYEQKEDQMRLMLMTKAWDRWRERFQEGQLQPLEYEVILRQQVGIMSRAFRTWRQKTLSLPAIQFHAAHTKSRYFKLWKNALPFAKQHSKAKEHDRINVLSRFFEEWRRRYQTKNTLKIVERAKNLRLPLANRNSMSGSRPLSFGPRKTIVRAPETTDEESSTVADIDTPRTRRPERYGGRVGRFGSGRRGDDGSQAPTRHSSPVRSIASYGGMRSRSPGSRRGGPPSVSAASEGDRLWTALSRFGPRRPL